MKIFRETKHLVENEKKFTYQILENLMIIEKNKLFADLKYPTLFNYLCRDLKYSEAEATIRVNAVRLMIRSSRALSNIKNGSLSLSNASKANQVIQKKKIKNKAEIQSIIDVASQRSTREFNLFAQHKLTNIRKELVVFDERLLIKLDRFKSKINMMSTSSYELIHILLERELKGMTQTSRLRNCKVSNSRYIPKSVRMQINTGECRNCGKMYDLELDHIKKYSHGGLNEKTNIQALCRNCNMRKEIKARHTNFFA